MGDMIEYSKEDREMLEEIKRYIEAHQMLEKNDIVIVGVSGGADSMCLLFVLEKLKQELEYDIVVVHVNHMLRGEAADQEERYVKTICEKYKIPCEVYHADVRRIAEKERLSEEEAGRIVRRRAFEETAEKYHANKIALAHHMDDNVETFLLHLTRGSKLKGLGGMHPVNGKYIRPFLEIRRKDIETYLKSENVCYFIDQTNAEDLYTRNRIRNHIVPFLCDSVNAQSVEHMNETMKYFRMVQEYLEQQMEILWKDMVEIKENGIFLKDSLREQSEVIRKMLIHHALVKAARNEKNLEECHVNSIDLLWGKQTGRQVDLPYRLVARRGYDGIEIRMKEEQEIVVCEEVCLALSDENECCVRYGELVVNCKVFKKTKEHNSVPKKTFTKWFDYDIIGENVSIRAPKQGDRLVVDVKGSSQKLKKYFVNEKIPLDKRKSIPVIAKGDQILWVVGYRQSKAYQVSEYTRTILEISINGGEKDGRDN